MTYYLFYVENKDLLREPGEKYAAAIPETNPLLHIYLTYYTCHSEYQVNT